MAERAVLIFFFVKMGQQWDKNIASEVRANQPILAWLGWG